MFERISVSLPDVGAELLFWKLEGSEEISQSFKLDIKLLSLAPRIDHTVLLGQPLTVNIPTSRMLNPVRYLNGKITAVTVEPTVIAEQRYTCYSLTLESDLWPLKHDRNMRIFQAVNVPQIVRKILKEYGVEVESRLTGHYRLWEYCVQYQESSYNFIMRLMELEGIAFFFQHQADRHTLVMIDDAAQHKPWHGYESVAWHATENGGTTLMQGIGEWSITGQVTPGRYSTDDYDFRKPYAHLDHILHNPASPHPGAIDYYDWPGHYTDHQHGERYARIRQQAWQAAHQRINASGTALGLVPGCTFALTNPPFPADAGHYLVVKAKYDFQENSYASGGTPPVHQLNIEVIPASTPFRPKTAATWPRTYGPQTARVMGPKGQSIWTDKYGRVKVKFHWDRSRKEDDTCSCWVRVSSAWASQGFGGIQIPRVQDEVVIDFINGDPDRPIITGRVYNEAKMPPWQLPAAATQMGFMSQTKDGVIDHANILRFDDKKGAEQVYIRAQRNMDTTVRNDEQHAVGGNYAFDVTGNVHNRVDGKRLQQTQLTENHLIGGDYFLQVKNHVVVASGGLLSLASGDSLITLNPNGTITLQCNKLEVNVKGEAAVKTGDLLNLNTPGTSFTLHMSSTPDEIAAAVQQAFSQKKEHS